VDKVAIFAVVIYGAYVFYKKLEKPISLYHLVAVITFLGTIVLYYLGYNTSQYCFDCDKTTADFYHGFMHFISCSGNTSAFPEVLMASAFWELAIQLRWTRVYCYYLRRIKNQSPKSL
jgi:hypothetical protein